MAFDVAHHSFGIGDESLSVRWSFYKAGYPVILDAAKYLACNDDMSGLEEHYFMIQGFKTS